MQPSKQENKPSSIIKLEPFQTWKFILANIFNALIVYKVSQKSISLVHNTLIV